MYFYYEVSYNWYLHMLLWGFAIRASAGSCKTFPVSWDNFQQEFNNISAILWCKSVGDVLCTSFRKTVFSLTAIKFRSGCLRIMVILVPSDKPLLAFQNDQRSLISIARLQLYKSNSSLLKFII